MSSIADLATLPVRKFGVPRKAGKWSITDEIIVDGETSRAFYRHLWHYTTRMLTVRGVESADGEIKYQGVAKFNPGWGSVTDKQGVNKFLNAAGLPTTYRELAARWVDARTEVVDVS